MTLKECVVRWYKDKTGRTEGAQSAFAEQVQVKTASVSHWIAGRCRPSKQRIESMAKILKLDRKQLERIIDDSNREWKEKEYQRTFSASCMSRNGSSFQQDIQPELIGVVGTISTPTFPSPDGLPAEEHLSLPVPPGYADGSIFALRVVGDFMRDVAADGEYLVIAKKFHSCKNGDICIARAKDGYGFYRVKASSPQLDLERGEFSPETEADLTNGENAAFGKVLWILRKP